MWKQLCFHISEIWKQQSWMTRQKWLIWSDLGCGRWILLLTSVWLSASHWQCQGRSSPLPSPVSIGKNNFSFSNKELGSSSCTRKKKSPSQIRREQRRKTERSLKKAAEPTEKVVEAGEFEESGPIVNSVELQCSQCDLNFKAEEDLNAHIGDKHTIMPTPEKERAPDQIADLLLTPIHGQRKEEETIPSPPSFSVVCDLPSTWFRKRPICGKKFTSEKDFRCHIHMDHSRCIQRYPTPCPWIACESMNHDILK